MRNAYGAGCCARRGLTGQLLHLLCEAADNHPTPLLGVRRGRVTGFRVRDQLPPMHSLRNEWLRSAGLPETKRSPSPRCSVVVHHR